jgi:hypothetical protein
MTPPAILVLVRTRDPHRQAEALRAALGLTLRGSRVEVAIDATIIETTEATTGATTEATGDPTGSFEAALATPLARRAAGTLRSFGYPVAALAGEALAAALGRAARVEVWT